MTDNINHAKKNILKKSEEIDSISIKGYDFNSDFSLKDFLDSYKTTGFQASNLAKAVEIIKKMRQEKAIFGGEASAHYFYRDFFYSDSSAISLLLILEFLSKNNLKMSEAIEEYRQAYFMYEETNFKVENTEAIFSALKEKFKDGKIDLTDGLSIAYPEWHLNIRGSNTQPLVRLNVEGKNPQTLDEKREKIIDLIESLGGKVVEE